MSPVKPLGSTISSSLTMGIPDLNEVWGSHFSKLRSKLMGSELHEITMEIPRLYPGDNSTTSAGYSRELAFPKDPRSLLEAVPLMPSMPPMPLLPKLPHFPSSADLEHHTGQLQSHGIRFAESLNGARDALGQNLQKIRSGVGANMTAMAGKLTAWTVKVVPQARSREVERNQAQRKQMWEQGSALEKSCDPVAAAAVFDELAKLDPTADTYIRLAKNLSDLCYLPHLGKKYQVEAFKKACDMATAAVEVDPSYSNAHLVRCISRGRLATLMDSRTKVLLAKQASDDAEQALLLDPNSDMAHHLMARWHYEMAGVSPIVRSLIGIIFGANLMPGTYPQALQHYRTAALISPEKVVHRVGLGQALLKAGDIPSAVKELESATKLQIEDINARYQVDEAYLLLKKVRQSKKGAQYYDLEGKRQEVAASAATASAADSALATAVSASKSFSRGAVGMGSAADSASVVAQTASKSFSREAVGSGSSVGADGIGADASASRKGGIQPPFLAWTRDLSTSVAQAGSKISDHLKEEHWDFSLLFNPGKHEQDLPVLSGISNGPKTSHHLKKEHWDFSLLLNPGQHEPDFPVVSRTSTRPSAKEIHYRTARGLKLQEECDPASAAVLFEDLAHHVPSSETLAHLAKNLSDMSFLPEVSRQQAIKLNRGAAKAAKAAIEANPSNAHAHLALCASQGRLALFSNLHSRVKLIKEASESARDALEVDPHNDLAHHMLGKWQYEMASIHPVARSLSGLLTGTDFMQGSYGEALKYFQTASGLAPTRLIHHAELGRTLLQVGDVRGAITELEASLYMEMEDIQAVHVRTETEMLLLDLKRSASSSSSQCLKRSESSSSVHGLKRSASSHSVQAESDIPPKGN